MTAVSQSYPNYLGGLNEQPDEVKKPGQVVEALNVIPDVTEGLTCLGLYGPNSRKLLSNISNDDFTNEGIKFSHGKFVTIDGVKVWAQRLSYVGELGYELYVKSSNAKDIYKKIIEVGKNFNISNCGMHALDTMRMESGFLHWGHDISPEENQYQAGLNFTISY